MRGNDAYIKSKYLALPSKYTHFCENSVICFTIYCPCDVLHFAIVLRSNTLCRIGIKATKYPRYEIVLYLRKHKVIKKNWK